jgi:hypothetical protein
MVAVVEDPVDMEEDGEDGEDQLSSQLASPLEEALLAIS